MYYIAYKIIWKSEINLPRKRRLFVSTVENVLIYGYDSWTLNISQQKSLNRTYTRMLRKALNISWKEHFTNKNLYGKLPLVSSKIKSKKIKMAAHYIRHPELSAHPLIVWEPIRCKDNRGRIRLYYILRGYIKKIHWSPIEAKYNNQYPR